MNERKKKKTTKKFRYSFSLHCLYTVAVVDFDWSWRGGLGEWRASLFNADAPRYSCLYIMLADHLIVSVVL